MIRSRARPQTQRTTATLQPQVLDEEMRNYYRAAFGTPAGQRVLDDLGRIANRTRIDASDPNPLCALYRAAQQALIGRIYNMLGENAAPALLREENDG